MRKVAIITGANGNVAKTISQRLINLGYDVHALTRTDADCSNPEQVRNLVNKFTTCDVLINCASSKAFRDSNYDQFDISMTNNAKSVLVMTTEFSRIMSQGSVVINISSVSGIHPGHSVAYSASKAAVESLTRSLATHLAPKTRVISIAPSFIEDTDRFDHSRKSQIINSTPLRRICTTKDVADAVEACINLLTFSTGTTIILDGGRLL
jgi:3-oxoacyl-[acyl-carrier protein] reductase